MTKSSNRTSVNIFLIRQTLKAGFAFMLILVLFFSGTYFAYLFSIQTWGCDLFRMKIAQVESGIARELILDQTGTAQEIIKTLESQLIGGIGKLQLNLIPKLSSTSIRSDQFYACKASLTGGQITYPILFGGEFLGQVKALFQYWNLQTVLGLISLIVILIGFILVALFYHLRSGLHEKLITPLRKLADQDATIESQELLEVDEIRSSIRLLNHQLQLAERKRLQQQKELELLGFATQVAHDIRSPLVALDLVLADTSQLPEDRRVLARSAVSRIKDICTNLLAHHRKKGDLSSLITGIEPCTCQLLPSLIDEIISEKRFEFRSRIDVILEARLDSSSYGLFANVQPSEFKRVISNLINNSIDAIPLAGKVTISLMKKENEISIVIEDNGKGIPSEILPQLFENGETYGKRDGNGLGLFHARTHLEKWGGKITIQSQVQEGTKVILEIPAIVNPKWFVPRLEIPLKSKIVIIDDDPSIHQIWQDRIGTFKKSGAELEIFNFSTLFQVLSWFHERPLNQGAYLYLVDYELLNEATNGLDIIEQLKIQQEAILVTSRFEDREILERCQRMNIRLIPKGMAGLVPLEILKAKKS
jgi:signal transduction histidine kinase